MVEPYQSGLLPYWWFKTVAEAKKSSAKIYLMFLGDSPGADMARVQPIWRNLRARRYANHEGGRKFDPKTSEPLPRSEDDEKAAATAVLYEQYVAARQHPTYVRLKKEHREKFKDG